jgi:hypothetical protein
MRKVLFLDFDGVLVKFKSPGKKSRPAVADLAVMTNLNRIVAETGAVAVLSTDWRLHNDCASLMKVLEKWGFIGKVIGMAPASVDDKRLAVLSGIEQIRARDEGTRVVVLDDDDLDLQEQVLIDPMAGLTEANAGDAVAKLNSVDALLSVEALLARYMPSAVESIAKIVVQDLLDIAKGFNI